MRFACRPMLASIVLYASALAATAATDVVPSCSSPQLLEPPQVLWEGWNEVGGIAWNGQDYALLWQTPTGTWFQRVYADGTPVGPPVAVPVNAPSEIRLVWNGAGYGAAFTSIGSYYGVEFIRLDANGNLVGLPLILDGYFSYHAYAPDIAWSGSGYAVVWHRLVSNYDIYASLLDASGNVTYSNIAVSTATGDQTYPRVTYSRGTSAWVAAWQDYRSGVKFEIWATQISRTGYVSGNNLAVTSSGSVQNVALADSGGAIGMAWADSRDGNWEIYFTTTNGSGQPVGPVTRVTNSAQTSINPVLLWDGGEYGLFFTDLRTGFYDFFFQRVGQSGALLDAPLELTYGANTSRLNAAPTSHGYMLAYGYASPLTVVPLGCSYPDVPACPDALWAYGISSSTATLSWAPVTSPYNDIAYYRIWRADRSTPVGITDSTYFTDTGLAAGTTYQYYVRAVNAAQYESSGCPNSIVYVKPSSAVALSVAKSGSDVNLAWNDAGQSTYRVMRGTSPQVMTVLGSTGATSTTDANAAANPAIYFYSIDIP